MIRIARFHMHPVSGTMWDRELSQGHLELVPYHW